tara:strand:- start:267972 stop:268898 length:927 start_codon:yes stop_codon:yes gene_type:complete
MPNNPAILLQGVTKTYDGQNAVDDLSLDVLAGESVALLGHNGAGKTTLIKLILGLVRPDKGNIRILGREPSSPGDDKTRCQLGYLPENIAFYNGMSGAETLAFFARLKCHPLSDCARILARVGLSDAAHKRVSHYSKGMRQRLGLAQALLGNPRVLMLDEPTTGLDPELRTAFYDIVRELEEDGVTIILSSHALTELEAHTRKIVIMRKGCLIASGTIDDLRRRANLPVHIRLITRPGMGAACAEKIPEGVTCERINDHGLDLTLPSERKIDVLRHLSTTVPELDDVDIKLPSLNDLYMHFQKEGVAS